MNSNKRNRVAPIREHAALEVELSALAFQVPGVHIRKGNEHTATLPQRSIFVKPELFKTPIAPSSHNSIAKLRNRRRFLVKEREDKRSLQTYVASPKEINFSEIVDIDDEAFENYVSSELAGRLVEGGAFRISILIIIILNSVLIGIQTDKALEKKYTALLTAADRCFLTIFIMEILVKWYYGFIVFWKLGWNVFDFAIVAASLLGPSITFLSSGRVLRILRVLRAFRTLRSISALNGLQVIVQTVLQSIPDMANIILLLMIIMFIFAVVGVTVFAEAQPLFFGDLGTAMFSLFICITQDGWIQIYEESELAGQEIATAIYLCIFITAGAFIFANLVVAVVVTNLELAFHEIKESTKRLNRDLKTDYKSNLNPASRTVDTRDLMREAAAMQLPIELPDFGETAMTPANLENYALVLAAIEENLNEFLALKKQLIAIFWEVQEINQNDSDGEAGDDFEDDESMLSEESEEVTDFLPAELRGKQRQRKGSTGDILSEMMKMERAGKINLNKMGNFNNIIKKADGAKSSNARTKSSFSQQRRSSMARLDEVGSPKGPSSSVMS